MAFFSNRRQQEQPEPDDRDAPRPATTHPIGFETVLGANSTLEGVLTSSGNVRLDGTFTGTLNINGNVLVGETAKINADVDARNISIAGAVRGNVNGNKVQLLRTGRVWGDISATALTTEEGAFIDGRITMKGHAANRSDTLPKEPPTIAPVTAPVMPSVEVKKPDEPDFLERIDAKKDDDTALNRPDLEPTLPLSLASRQDEDEK